MSTTTHLPHPLRAAAIAVSAVFLLVGVLGFLPGVTSDIDGITLAGPESRAHLLGLFHVSVLHNVVHLLFGMVGVIMSRGVPGARAFLIGGGVVYLLLWLYGVVVDKASPANVVPLNDADDWLHLGLGVGMVALGVALKANPNARSA